MTEAFSGCSIRSPRTGPGIRMVGCLYKVAARASAHPRFGTLEASAGLLLMPAEQPTFQADRTLVTPGLALTVSGERWYPGDPYTITYWGAQRQDGGWADGPNCGKAVNPALGTVTVDANGWTHQQ